MSKKRNRGGGSRRRPGQRRHPAARRTAKGPRTAQPGRGAALEELARELLKAGRELVEEEDPLRVEFEMSGFLSLLRIAAGRGEDPEAVMARVLVPRLERDGTAIGRSLLLALAAVSGPELARAGREADERLGAAGVPAPPWRDDVGTARFTEAWLAHEPYGDQESVLIAMRYGARPPHLLTVIVDRNLGGIAKDASVADDAPAVIDRWRSEPMFTLAPLDERDAGLRVLRAVEESDRTLDAPVSGDFVGMRSLLVATARRLAGAEEAPPGPEPEPFPHEERERLVEDFLASPGARGLPPAARDEAEAMIAARADWAGDDPLRWSPIVVELFMLDWVPNRAILEEEILDAVPATLRAWVRYAGRVRGMPGDLVEETARSIDEWEEEFRKAIRDDAAGGPTRKLVKTMLAEGVSPTDRDAVARWMEGYNARPYEERRRLTGG